MRRMKFVLGRTEPGGTAGLKNDVRVIKRATWFCTKQEKLLRAALVIKQENTYSFRSKIRWLISGRVESRASKISRIPWR